MAVVVHPPPVTSPTLHDSHILPNADFNTHPIIRSLQAPNLQAHHARYNTALEAEHSRELYLQGAMAVGQIARLLEELCADNYNADLDEEDTVADDERSIHPSDTIGIHQFVTHEKRDHIVAWARAVSPADDISGRHAQPPCDAEVDIIDLKDADVTYLRGAFVVGDIADLLHDLVKGLDDKPEEETRDEEERQQKSAIAFSPEQVALTQLTAESSLCSRRISDLDFASRLSCLSARLAKLELDINTFSRDRNDALKQMELDDYSAATMQHSGSTEEPDQSECVGLGVEGVDNYRVNEEYMADALGICDTLESENSLLITRVCTMTDTATSGFSLVTPPGLEIQPVIFEPIKDYFWGLD